MSYTCGKCGSTSQNVDDERNRYCGRCHVFEDDLIAAAEMDRLADLAAAELGINELVEVPEALAMSRNVPGDVVIRIVRLQNAGPTPFDGQWVVEYDPSRPGADPNGAPMLAHLVTSPDKAKALRLDGLVAAHQLWTKEIPGCVRFDGRPERPLTAFAVTIEPADD